MLVTVPSSPPTVGPALPHDLTVAERAALQIILAPDPAQGPLRAAYRQVRRLLEPLDRAGQMLGLAPRTRRTVQRAVMAGILAHGTAYGRWDAATWVTVARATGGFAANVLGVAYRFGAVSGEQLVDAGLHPTYLARRLYGRTAVDNEVERVRSHLLTVGYGRSSLAEHALPGALAVLFLHAGRAELEAVTVEAIEVAHQAAPLGSGRRTAYYRLAQALHGMGLLPRTIARRVYPRSSLADVDPEWVACWQRWDELSTLAPLTRHTVKSALLRAGRWLAREHPHIRTPDGWTRELALLYVAAVNHAVLGDCTGPDDTHKQHFGDPVSPPSKDRYLGALRIFFRDCQEWGWCARRFDPARALATPRSVKALMGPKPRVLADDVWAKLLWAGLSLEETDLPTSLGGIAGGGAILYPLTLVKALTITWLFSGLRCDEIVRLRVGCIRWQQSDGGPGAGPAHQASDGATCLLDVPTHKTGASYTKPVDPLLGEAVAAWEAQRPSQPLMVDRKTGERVAVLFCLRGRMFNRAYINRTLIPLLCRKAGLPLSDARGRITSHRARATIASQLYNAKEPMTLFELQAWLGHRSPQSTQYYARITPTTLAKAYADAGYFARNVRTIEVLLDRDAVLTGGAATGQPWQYFDLGHGFCSYSFFEQCPHRLACARCDFYLPKDSSKAQLLEASGNLQRMLAEIPLTDDERAAVEDGTAAVEHLIERLADTPTPAGPTPRELSGRLPFVALSALTTTSGDELEELDA